MRITATIIDEDLCACVTPSKQADTSKHGEKKYKDAYANWLIKNFAGKHKKRMAEFLLKKNPEPIRKDLNHYYHKVNEMTRKFKNLHLSDALSLHENSYPILETVCNNFL
ncbi:hypothetical protein CDAR_448093 [Caerostris darwini]|uniref:Uncharacterized protein n=1 Tax=Caerostris darwini TaxID=1538125 RepID=A0AAV4W637_9ARAC|nr:hypothetical protein CDAR_448093 [Caerostris darwini]